MAERDVQDPQALGRAQELGHEFRDVNMLLIMASGLGLLLLVGLALIAVYGLAVVWGGGTLVPSTVDSDAMPPLARQDFQANQHLIRMAMEQQQRDRLTSYGWVDRTAGTARIPIERAIHILGERGSLKAAGTVAEPPAPSDDSPLEKTRNPKVSTERTSGQKSSPDKSSPDKSSPDKSSPDKSSPDKSSPDKSSPDKSSPDKTSTETTPTDKTPTDKTPSEKTLSEEARG